MTTKPSREALREQVSLLVKETAGAIQARGMYGGSHKLSQAAVDSLNGIFGRLFAAREEVTIGIVGDEVIFEDEPIYGLARSGGGFIAAVRDAGVDKITFVRAPSREEIARFLETLSAASRGGDPEKVRRLLESAELPHIFMGRIAPVKEGFAGMLSGNFGGIAKEVFDEGGAYLQKAFTDIRQNKPIDISAARFFVVKLMGNLAQNKTSLLMLTSLKSHDEYTFVHSINVAIFSLIQAEALGLGERSLGEVGIAGLLHDAGKLALPGSLLRKKTELSEGDFRRIHAHPSDGAKLLLESVGSNPLAAIAAFEHHVRFDQKGYPPRLFGGPMNPASTMIAIADVYDALRSKRAYHEDMAPEKTYEEMMKMSGKNFDPKLLANFFQIVGVYSPGTLVQMEDRSIGIVVRESSLDIRRPQVELLYDARGEKVTGSRIINLLEKDRTSGNFRWTIAKSVAPGKHEIPEKYRV